MLRDMIVLAVIVLSLFGVVALGAVAVSRHACMIHGEIVGKPVRYDALAGCYVKDGNVWIEKGKNRIIEEAQ